MINPYEVLSQIFSKDGFVNEFCAIKFENHIEIKLTQEGNKYLLSFGDSKPSIKLKRYIQLTLKLSSIILGESGGILKLDFFPDIPFKYDWLKK